VDERDDWDPSARFRARVRHPQLSKRFDAFIGKVDPEEYVTELRDDSDTLPRQFGRERDDAVLLGLGHGQPGRGGGHFDASVGARLGWPLEPYAKGTYRFVRLFLDRNLVRLRDHNLGNGRALAYQGGIAGESDHEVGISDYGLRVIFRRRIYHEWLFLDLRSSITWPRETLLERRESKSGCRRCDRADVR
jgi:hypothetical protein